jgi:hypothetical protein
MKKYIKQTTVFFTSVVLTCSILFGALINPVSGFYYDCDLNKMHDEFVAEFGYEFVKNYKHAIETIEELYDYFPTSEFGAVYPDYFGGRYINDEGELVLLKAPLNGSMITPTFKYFDDTIVKEVEFSFNELSAKMDLLDEYSSKSENIENVSGWALDSALNRIIIYLIDYSDEAINSFRNEIMDSPKFMFEEGEEISQVDALQSEEEEVNLPKEPIISNPVARASRTLYPGDTLTFWRSGVGWLNQSLSIGYRTYQLFSNGFWQAGFITAAHVGADSITGWGLRNGDIVADSNFSRIGVVNGAELYGYDAAFVLLDNPNQVMPINSDSGNSMYGWIVQGQVLWMHGGRSGWQSGFVLNERSTILLGPIATLNGSPLYTNVYNVISASYFGQPGDSGSPVYTTQVINNRTYITGVAGIHIARNQNLARSFVSRADHIRYMHSPNVTYILR